jgi:hypothetical protein
VYSCLVNFDIITIKLKVAKKGGFRNVALCAKNLTPLIALEECTVNVIYILSEMTFDCRVIKRLCIDYICVGVRYAEGYILSI